MNKCEICNEDSSESGSLQTLYNKGYENLTRQCKQLKDSSLLARLEMKWTSNTPIVLHRNCRSIYMQRKPSTEEKDNGPRPKRKKVEQKNDEACNSGKGYSSAHEYRISVNHTSNRVTTFADFFIFVKFCKI